MKGKPIKSVCDLPFEVLGRLLNHQLLLFIASRWRSTVSMRIQSQPDGLEEVKNDRSGRIFFLSVTDPKVKVTK